MIIDFHTHVFPDKIANATINSLANKADINPWHNGTVKGLLSQMEASNVDEAIALPVLTKAKQFDSILQFTKAINNTDFGDKKIISFMGVHPDSIELEDEIKLIKENGFKGIKIHPDYQNTYFDDDKYVKILSLAKEHDLIVVTHAGVDYGFKGEDVKCTPKRVLSLLNKVKDVKLVLAHYGGHMMLDEVFNTLCGLDVYFDTSFILKEINKDDFVKILNKHGADKILFATDSPWSSMDEDVKRLKSFNLGKEIEDLIFYKNAQKLLGI